ncbi:anti-repressor SinI family protein [Salimicrobium sp. PL1-032A]|uniref:anti-repressor SinI family protein n=1 Tax=Salimicrobium sp. PL1-032A TaxID=3095364 RepID=UPI0032609718
MISLNKTLDFEWVDLLKEARDMGIAPEEVRAFLSKPNQERSPKIKTAKSLS